MYRKKNLLFLTLLMTTIFYYSCSSIPPGIAPKGNIIEIDNFSKKYYSPKEALDNIITEVATSPLLAYNSTPPRVALIANSNNYNEYGYEAYNIFLNLSLGLYKNLISSNLIRFSTNDNADYLMISKFKYICTIYNSKLKEKERIFKWTVALKGKEKNISSSYYTNIIIRNKQH